MRVVDIEAPATTGFKLVIVADTMYGVVVDIDNAWALIDLDYNGLELVIVDDTINAQRDITQTSLDWYQARYHRWYQVQRSERR